MEVSLWAKTFHVVGHCEDQYISRQLMSLQHLELPQQPPHQHTQPPPHQAAASEVGAAELITDRLQHNEQQAEID